MVDSPALPSLSTVASAASDAEEVRERELLRTHDQLIALCSAIVQSQPKQQHAVGSVSGFNATMQTIVEAVMDIFQQSVNNRSQAQGKKVRNAIFSHQLSA